MTIFWTAKRFFMCGKMECHHKISKPYMLNLKFSVLLNLSSSFNLFFSFLLLSYGNRCFINHNEYYRAIQTFRSMFFYSIYSKWKNVYMIQWLCVNFLYAEYVHRYTNPNDKSVECEWNTHTPTKNISIRL